MKALRGILAGALGMLLGLQALRTFLTGLVWLIGESLSPNAMGMIALCVITLGLMAGPVATRLGRARTERLTAAVLTVLYLGSLAVPDTPVRTGLAAAAAFVWVWWFSAFVTGRRSLGTALVGGLSLDVAVHAALHGLDLPVANRGLTVALLGAAFVATAADPEPDGPPPGWGLVALAPWLFIQLEVLTNLARIRLISGFGAGGAVLLMEAGLALCLVVLALPMSGLMRAGLGILASFFLVHPTGWAWVFAVQAGAAAALAGSFRPGRWGFWPPLAMVLLVGLLFLFYAQATLPLLHASAAGALGLIAMAVHSGARLTCSPRAAVIPAGLALAGLLASLIAPGTPVMGPPPARDTVRLMTYNIHQGLDVQSRPDVEGIIRTIEAQSPDIVGLQEVNRGWTISGASDIISYIEERMPQYHVVYGPMVGDLWGSAILSRYPILESGSRRYERGLFYTMGFTWAVIRLPDCDALVLNTHLSTGRELDDERTSQMDQLLAHWNGRPCSVIMGDVNAEPTSKPIRDMKAAGFTDWLGVFTAPRESTWPADRPTESIDYIATTADLRGVAARSVPSLASDHRPVVVDLLAPP